MATKARIPARDREYLENQIAYGHTVNVNGVSYNKANVKDLPTQAELDAGGAVPVAGSNPLAGGAPPLGSMSQQPGSNEPEFAGKKLSFYTELSDDQIGKVDGVTPAIAKQIRAAIVAAKK